MAHPRPNASDLPAAAYESSRRSSARGTDGATAGLTRAQAHALRRSSPMTASEFKEHRRIIEQGSIPLAAVLTRVTGVTAGSGSRSADRSR